MRVDALVKWAIAVDARVVIALNARGRRSAWARGLVARAATGLAAIEVVLMVALALAGRRRSAARMLAAVGLVYVSSEVLGRLWQRERPFGGLAQVEGLVPHSAERSFPSRHVASGLAMAMIGGRAQPLVGGAMAMVAWLLGLSRVAVGLHYPSDVFAGALLGSLIGRLLRE